MATTLIILGTIAVICILIAIFKKKKVKTAADYEKMAKEKPEKFLKEVVKKYNHAHKVVKENVKKRIRASKAPIIVQLKKSQHIGAIIIGYERYNYGKTKRNKAEFNNGLRFYKAVVVEKCGQNVFGLHPYSRATEIPMIMQQYGVSSN